MKRFHADRAARKRGDDLLGRVPMAEQLADAFVGWREDESLVVSLAGNWGSGKTSIKNFVVDALQPEGSGGTRADVLEFSPWELSGGGDVEGHFFARIGAFLGRKDGAGVDRQIARKWAKWTAALRIPEAMVDPLTKYLSAPAIILGLTGILSGAAVERMPWIVSGAIMAVLGFAFSISSTITDRVAQFFNSRADTHDVSASELKEQLANLLRKRERPLVLVIDDLDRLTSTEIRLIFRLIKANADLPRILYFLLFEREAVVRALEREGFESGGRYLEKIVQASFEVPAIQTVMLNDVLIARLNDILRELPETEQVEEQRWTDLFFQRLHIYFKTLRDVYRFLAALEFHIAVFRRGDSFEVNFVDLFILETLRMFEPAVYERIHSHKVVLVGGALSRMDTSTDAAKKILVDITVGADQPGAVSAALSELFPRASWAWGGHHYGEGFDVRWTAAKRVGTDTHFEKYFFLGLAKGDIAQSELDTFIRSSDQRDVLRKQIRAFKNDGRIERLLVRLRSGEAGRVPVENTVSFVTAMLDEGDDLPRRKDMWGMDADLLLTGIVYRHVIRLKTVQEREESLRQAITLTEALYSSAYVVSFEEPGDEKNTEHEQMISVASLPEFKQVCVSKIARAAEKGLLLRHPHMLSLIYYWLKWSGDDAVKSWASEIIKNPEDAVTFLLGFVQFVKRSGIGSLVTQQIPKIELKSVEKFVALDAFENALANAVTKDENALSAVRMFRKALNRRRKGLPDQDGLSIRNEDDDDE